MGDFGVRSVPSGPICHQRVTPAPVSVTLTRPGGGDFTALVSVVQVGFQLPVSPGSSAFEGDVYPSPVPGSGRLDSSILCSVNRLPYLLRKSRLSPSVPFHLDSLPTLSEFGCLLFFRSLPWEQFAYSHVPGSGMLTPLPDSIRLRKQNSCSASTGVADWGYITCF